MDICAERWKGRGGSRVARLGSKQLLGADTPRAALRGVHADGGSRGLSRGWGARGDEPDPLASNLAQPALFFAAPRPDAQPPSWCPAAVGHVGVLKHLHPLPRWEGSADGAIHRRARAARRLTDDDAFAPQLAVRAGARHAARHHGRGQPAAERRRRRSGRADGGAAHQPAPSYSSPGQPRRLYHGRRPHAARSGANHIALTAAVPRPPHTWGAGHARDLSQAGKHVSSTGSLFT